MHTERFPRFQVAPDLPDVIADESLLRTAIAALIDNAVAFTDSQPLVIQVEHHPSSSGTCALVVADSGLGIPASALEGVFELFTRLDKRRGEGVGVGLTMAKRAVERCGGT